MHLPPPFWKIKYMYVVKQPLVANYYSILAPVPSKDGTSPVCNCGWVEPLQWRGHRLSVLYFVLNILLYQIIN